MKTKFYKKDGEYRLDCNIAVHVHLTHEENHRGLIMLDVEPAFFQGFVTCLCNLTSETDAGVGAKRTNLRTGVEEESQPITIRQCNTLLRIIPTFFIAGNVCFAKGAPKAFLEKECTKVLTRDEATDLLTVFIEKFTPDIHILDYEGEHDEPVVSENPLVDLLAMKDICIHFRYDTTTHVPDVTQEHSRMGFGKSSHLH